MAEEGTGLKVLNDLARQFADARKQKEENERESKKINQRIELIRQQLISLMTAQGNLQFRLENVGLIYISMPPRPRIINKEGFFKWLEENNEDYIIKPAVHHKTLMSWFKQMNEKFEKEGKDLKQELTGMVAVFEEPQLNLRRE